MFKWIKRRRLIEELNAQYFLMSIYLREWIYNTERYLEEDDAYNKNNLRRNMNIASKEFTILEESIGHTIRELREL